MYPWVKRVPRPKTKHSCVPNERIVKYKEMSAMQRTGMKKPKRQFKPPATELRVGRVPIEKQPTNPNLPPRELSVSTPMRVIRRIRFAEVDSRLQQCSAP